MAALQCEICGGKLMAKSGGLFECEYCGMQYDKTRIQEMVQEIKGTVKVEGTVQVTGTVKVEGSVNIDNYLKRGQMALADGNWESARTFFDEALNINAECSDAYLGILMAQNQLRTSVELSAYLAADLRNNINYEKVIRFGTVEQKRLLTNWERNYDDFCAREAATKAAKFEKASDRLRPYRESIQMVQTGIVSTGNDYVLGLKTDGTVLLAGENKYVQSSVADWKDITYISANTRHALGIRTDGTVVSAGNNESGQCDVYEWEDIIAVAAGVGHSVGLREDGTVVAVGDNSEGQCNVEEWSNIIAVTTGGNHTVGLRLDGTVVATGRNKNEFGRFTGQCNVSGWTGIVAVAAGYSHTVGVKADGTVVAVGDRDKGRLDVSGWTDIIAVAAGDRHTVGLKYDGTVVTTGKSDRNVNYKVDDWKNIVAIDAYNFDTVGIRADGTIVTVGHKFSNVHHTTAWKLFDDLQNYEQECIEQRKLAQENRDELNRRALEEAMRREEAARLAEEVRQKKIAVLNSEKVSLNTELRNLKGLFTGKRRREIETRLAEIETELKGL